MFKGWNYAISYLAFAMLASGCVTEQGTELGRSQHKGDQLAPASKPQVAHHSAPAKQRSPSTLAAASHKKSAPEGSLPPPPAAPQPATAKGSAPTKSTQLVVGAVAKLVAGAQAEAAHQHWEMASAKIERAYRIAPKNPRVTHTKSAIMLAQEKYDQAESWSLRTLQLLHQGDEEQELAAWQIIHTCRAALHKNPPAQQESLAKIKQLKEQLHVL